MKALLFIVGVIVFWHILAYYEILTEKINAAKKETPQEAQNNT